MDITQEYFDRVPVSSNNLTVNPWKLLGVGFMWFLFGLSPFAILGSMVALDIIEPPENWKWK